MCKGVLHEGLLISVLLYVDVTMIWREYERSIIMAVQLASLKGLLGIRRIDRVLYAWIRELCGVAKGIDESVLHWFGHTERMENDK